MRFALIVLATVLLGGCTTLVKDCEQQGIGSQYWHCKRVFVAR